MDRIEYTNAVELILVDYANGATDLFETAQRIAELITREQCDSVSHESNLQCQLPAGHKNACMHVCNETTTVSWSKD